MHHLRFVHHRSSPEFNIPAAPGGDYLSARDAVGMLRLLGLLGSIRSDPRHWRQELLSGITQILPATAAVAMTIKSLSLEAPPTVTAIFDSGFRSEPQRQFLLKEFNVAPFGDPLSKKMLNRFVSQHLETLTCLRGDVVENAEWSTDAHVLTYRKPTAMGDCILSFHRASERGTAYALLVMRASVTPPGEGSMPAGVELPGTGDFAARERVLMDTLHRGLDWIYRAEEASQKVTRASALRPRLRETLELILSGHTERQVADRMNLSVHTVHDYVKSIYLHFGVSSRTELLRRWVQDGGQIPPRT